MAGTRKVERTVGRYEILREIGRGGMATVFLAQQTDLDRPVALKELSAFRQADPAFVRRFLRESRLAGALNHPNIVTVLDYFEAEGTPYIAMEYVAGGALRPQIGHMSLAQVAGVLEGILAGLDHASRQHVVHRDLKPENVMVTADGRVKIGDFGIAKATSTTGPAGALTATGMTVGTPNYMAPEQAMGRELGPWTDLYSVGVMAFEIFVGRVPFADTEEPVAVLMRQVSDDIPPAASVNPDVDPAISDWIGHMVAKDPADRTQSPADAWDELEEVLIPLVGARWRRASRLSTGIPQPGDAPAGPATPPPTEAAAPPMTSMVVPDTPPRSAQPRARRTRTGQTRRMTRDVERAGAATVAPAAAPTAATRLLPSGRKGARVGKVAVALLVVGLALAAALAGGGGGGAPEPAAAVPVTPVSGPAMGLKVPQGWTEVSEPPDLGLNLSRPVAFAPPDRSGMVEFGMARDHGSYNSDLMPAAFLDSAGAPGGGEPRRTAVRLPEQGLEAWRYPNLRPVGFNRPLSVYTVPTTAGVATLACAASVPTCDAIAGTLSLSRARAYAVGPSDTYADALNTAMSQLQLTTQAQEASFQSAQTLDQQAAAATALASGYDTAASQLAGLRLSPADTGANVRLVAALTEAADVYRRAARTATGGDAAAYRTASAAIPGATQAVNAALEQLRDAGYSPAGQQAAPTEAPGEAPAAEQPAGGQAEGAAGGGEDSGVGDSQSDDPSDDSAEP